MGASVNIVLLGHQDIASLYALNLLMHLLPDHRYTAFMSGDLGSSNTIPGALRELAKVDAKLCAKYLGNSRVSEVLKIAPELGSPNSSQGLATLRQCDPDLIVSIRYRRILHDDAISVPRQGVLNLHSGILPEYRGVMATFWAMLNDEAEIGTTLHRIVDSGIDTGPVIGISRTATNRGGSYLANVLGLYANGCSMLAMAVSDLGCGKSLGGSRQSPGSGQYFSTPDAAAIKAFVAKSLKIVTGKELEAILE